MPAVSYSFQSAGNQVLEEAQKDLINYKGTGMSIMEMSHRGKEFEAVIKKAEEDLRKLMNIPSNYKVLFLQGKRANVLASIGLTVHAACQCKHTHGRTSCTHINLVCPRTARAHCSAAQTPAQLDAGSCCVRRHPAHAYQPQPPAHALEAPTWHKRKQ